MKAFLLLITLLVPSLCQIYVWDYQDVISGDPSSCPCIIQELTFNANLTEVPNAHLTGTSFNYTFTSDQCQTITKVYGPEYYLDLTTALQANVTTEWISQIVAPGCAALLKISDPFIDISYYKMTSDNFNPNQDTFLGEVQMYVRDYYPDPYATAPW